ncbi:MAG: hypothetical protein NTX53_20585 [candidate division WOR-3 bacterium]|nr:hypothetical protein [candidate division WOR-3 bacterium]
MARHLTVGTFREDALSCSLRVNPSYVQSGSCTWYNQLTLKGFGSSGTFVFGGVGSSETFVPRSDSQAEHHGINWNASWDSQIPTDSYEISGCIIRHNNSTLVDSPFSIEAEPNVRSLVVRSNFGFRLLPYYGDQRYGNSTETLGFQRSYSLCVQAKSLEDTTKDWGLDGVEIQWHPKPGCNETIVSSMASTRELRYDSVEGVGGLSECTVKLPSSCGIETEDTIIASASGSADAKFAVIRIPDADMDDDPVLPGAPDSLHEWYPYTTQPYLGDGLWGTGDLGSPDGKDVVLEVDYCWPDLGANDGEARQRLDSALTKVQDIFYTTGGINVYYDLDEKLELSDVPRGMGDTTAMRVLKEHRNWGGRGDAFQQGCLHLIVGGTDDNPKDMAMTEYAYVVHRGMYYGSTGLSPDGQNDQLKEVGCFAFPVAFDSRLTWGQIGSGVGMTKEAYLALAIAHEVGHALGLTHPQDGEWSSVMSPGFGAFRDYTYYAQFKNPPPDEVSQHWQINARKLLGRDGCEIRGNRWIYQ